MTYLPGDVLLVEDYSGHGDLIGNLIRAGERCRYGVGRWTHSALVVSADGDIVEAEKQGVERNNISKYVGHHAIKLISFPVALDDPRRAFAVRYALAQVGDPYGVLGFVSLAVDLLFGLKIGLHVNRQLICSELASRATESMTETGYPFPSEQMMPEDLDAWWLDLAPSPLSAWRRWLLLAQAVYWWVVPWRHGIKPVTNRKDPS